MEYDSALQQVVLEELYGLCVRQDDEDEDEDDDEDDEDEDKDEQAIIQSAEDLADQLDARVSDMDSARVYELLNAVYLEKKFEVLRWLLGKTLVEPGDHLAVAKARKFGLNGLAGWLAGAQL